MKSGDKRFRHGMTSSKEYRIWTNMKTRCFNKRNNRYPDYGGRGITMCDRWRNDFSLFFEDMGRCPDGMTMERRDTNGNYEPVNCYWADWFQQQNNRRDNLRLTFDGETKTCEQWTRHLGLKTGTVSVRLRKGIPLDRALTAGNLRYVVK